MEGIISRVNIIFLMLCFVVNLILTDHVNIGFKIIANTDDVVLLVTRIFPDILSDIMLNILLLPIK